MNADSGRRGLSLAGVTLIGAATALGWPSLVAAGLIPLLVSLAPCLIMCALGVCMMTSCSKGSGTSQAASPVSRPLEDRVSSPPSPAPNRWERMGRPA